MTDVKRTPGPWLVNEVRTSCGRAFRIGTGEMITAGKGCCIIYDDYPVNPNNERAANAAFIVTACNAHDELVAALRRQRANIEKWLASGVPADALESKSIYDQICAALASVEGGS